VNQLVAAGMLEKLGYEVLISANGQEAVSQAAEKPYDVILMDCLMPVMDGYEATRQIRRNPGPNRRTPIIALTASAMAGDRERCLVAGMDDYLSKPLDPADLATTIKRFRDGVGRPNRLPDSGDADSPAPEAPHPLDEAVLNGLRNLGGAGDGSFLGRVIEAYLEDVPKRLAELRLSVAGNDPDATLRVAHTLKGSCRNIGARRLAELCEALERMAGNSDLASASETLHLVEEEFVQVRLALDEELHPAS
jgi:CheY-like chemotaxis protein